MHHFFSAIPAEDLEMIKHTAMNRHHVKRSKREHVKTVLDEAFKLAMEYSSTGNFINNGNNDNE